MFEFSIGNVTDQEEKPFQKFNVTSKQASAWLKRYRTIRGKLKRAVTIRAEVGTGTDASTFEADGFIQSLQLVDDLLEIGEGTNLLADTKDIRDNFKTRQQKFLKTSARSS